MGRLNREGLKFINKLFEVVLQQDSKRGGELAGSTYSRNVEGIVSIRKKRVKCI